MAEKTTVIGRVETAEEVPAFQGATAYFQILDASLADAPSRVVVEEIRRGVDHLGGTGGIAQFELHTARFERGHRYVVRVHIDMGDTGDVSIGDLLTMEAIPVRNVGGLQELLVRVRPVP